MGRIAGETRAALLDSAQDLIQRVGVNAMSYNDLSRVVGIRKASIHHHFPRKEDLIEALLVRCGEDYAGKYQSVVTSPGSIWEKLQAVVDIFDNSLMAGKICTVGMLSVESPTLTEKLRHTLERTLTSSVEKIEDIFVQGVADQTFPGLLNTREAANAFHDFLLGSQIVARSLGDPGRFRQSADTYLRLLRSSHFSGN